MKIIQIEQSIQKWFKEIYNAIIQPSKDENSPGNPTMLGHILLFLALLVFF